MHIIFFNPQGNFDALDSHLTEHADFGGQLVYVKEVAMAMARQGHRIDIITRRMDDPEWPEFSAPIDYYPGFGDNLRIVRLDCGGPLFLEKEQLWPHLDELVTRTIAFYGDDLPDFATAHYADGGYCAVLFKARTGTGFTLTGHSLGAQKLDKLGANVHNWDKMERRFRFSHRIAAERLAMERAFRIITSTRQEWQEQYAHPLYKGAVDVNEPGKFSVIPPGVNTTIFTTEAGPGDAAVRQKLEEKLPRITLPSLLVSSRLDEKKNIIGVVRAYACSPRLQEKSDLVLCIRGIEDMFADIGTLSEHEQAVLQAILDVIDGMGIRERVHVLNIASQAELAATYRILADHGGVFALTSVYEPFGLAPIEAAACGLACVATRNGGPSEIFADGSGILVDPFDVEDIAAGLLRALDNAAELSRKGRERVLSTYTWDKTAASYLKAITEGASRPRQPGEPIPDLEVSRLIVDYLIGRQPVA